MLCSIYCSAYAVLMFIPHIVVNYYSIWFKKTIIYLSVCLSICALVRTWFWHYLYIYNCTFPPYPWPWYPTYYFHPSEDKITNLLSWPGRFFQSAEDTVSRQHAWGAAGFSPAVRQSLCVWGPVRLWAQLQHLLPQQEGPAAALAAVPERWACWQTGRKAWTKMPFSSSIYWFLVGGSVRGREIL